MKSLQLCLFNESRLIAASSSARLRRAKLAYSRVTLRTVLASLAEGSSFQEILQDYYPSLSEEHVRAVVAFAATSAKEDLPIQSLPAAR
jgi:uncharacterized protein (DUF433 family)